MKKTLIKTLAIPSIVFGTWGLWRTLEVIFYKEVQPRTVDNFIGIALWASLWFNFSHWLDKKD